jgi:hypothetical protein
MRLYSAFRKIRENIKGLIKSLMIFLSIILCITFIVSLEVNMSDFLILIDAVASAIKVL